MVNPLMQAGIPQGKHEAEHERQTTADHGHPCQQSVRVCPCPVRELTITTRPFRLAGDTLDRRLVFVSLGIC
jgi:hypothetical protein